MLNENNNIIKKMSETIRILKISLFFFFLLNRINFYSIMKRTSAKEEHERETSFDDSKINRFQKCHFTWWVPSRQYDKFKMFFFPHTLDQDVRLKWMFLFDIIILGLILFIFYNNSFYVLNLLILKSIVELYLQKISFLENEETSNERLQIIYTLIDIIIVVVLTYQVHKREKSIQLKNQQKMSKYAPQNDMISQRMKYSNSPDIIKENKGRSSSLRKRANKIDEKINPFNDYSSHQSRESENKSSNKKPSKSQNKNRYHSTIDVLNEENDEDILYNNPKEENKLYSERKIILSKNNNEGQANSWSRKKKLMLLEDINN